MKIKKLLGIAGLAVVASAVLVACGSKTSSSDGKEEVNFATVGTTKPFSYEKDGKLTGYDVEVAKAVFKDSDKYKVNFEKIEWSSLFTGIDAGKYQMGGNNISFSKERASKYLFSTPIGSTPSVLVVPKDSDITSYDDISGHSTQVVQGTSTATQLENYNKEHSSNPVDINYTEENINQMLANVNSGKFDFKIFDAPSVNTIIKDQGLDNVKTIDLPSDEKPFIYFIFGSDQEDLQDFVNKRLKELEKDGTLAKLSEEYLGGNYAPSADEMKIPSAD
ncbi:amino acid ABC transporter substrate-binding protein [Streptococcus sp. zg-JUN1979]|uniref:amino acid ABC transporter substrate-binding protein n=1 Tax=Streptococcus sp. zg-JUN1979 TaxID=3391450 RepID=UPI0039A7454E